MRAVVYERFGPPEVLQVREVPRPTPGDREVLVRIRATTVTSADCRARARDVPAGYGPVAYLVFGFFRPRQPILGAEFAGEVAAVGKEVREFSVGDPVFGFTDAAMGCYAEYRCIPADGKLARKPGNLSYAEAAALTFGGTTALHYLRKARVQRGERVLVNGASGAVGNACVQLARHFGAEVTGVCSTANVEMVKASGAAHVVDYSQADFTQNGRTYDVIVDTVGTAPFSRCSASLGERGRLVLILASLPDMLRAPWISMTGKKKVIVGVALGRPADVRFLGTLAEAGGFKPVIDRRYPLSQIVEAHRYVDTGRKKGNVVVTLDDGHA
ncbi:MAG: NAD(P)-dependent alcohol dehydrogenase [Chloroflexota bacterium]